MIQVRMVSYSPSNGQLLFLQCTWSPTSGFSCAALLLGLVEAAIIKRRGSSYLIRRRCHVTSPSRIMRLLRTAPLTIRWGCGGTDIAPLYVYLC
jgi:hypothetical protein